MTIADAPDVLTVSEVAELLRVGRNAAYQLVGSGQLWGVKVGRSIRVPRRSVERFLANEPQAETKRTAAPTKATVPEVRRVADAPRPAA